LKIKELQHRQNFFKAEGGKMKIGNLEVRMFKIKNRKGFAAICSGHLTEGKTEEQAYDRMVKAVRRTSKRKK
jgi:hypothetical protein